jgi:MoxR-like ATPase
MISIKQVLRSIGRKTFSESCNFENIYGLEKEKQALMMALTAKRPCHVLLVGPPGIGKTELVLSIYNTNKTKAYFTYGGHSTKAGIVDQLFHDRPRILVVDELETMSAHDQVSLLGLCENGILAETKITKTRQTRMNVWVFATSNCTKRILPPLLSRFIVVNLKRPARDEFIEMGRRILFEKEGIDPTIALYIASQVYDKKKNADLRDVIKIARASNGEVRKINLLIHIMSDRESK